MRDTAVRDKFSGIEWTLILASGAVILPTVIALLGGGEYLRAIWRGLPEFASSLAGVLVLLLAVALYLLPTVVAYTRKHTNAVAIFVVNLFFGWTLIGWVAAMVWAVINRRPAPQQPSS